MFHVFPTGVQDTINFMPVNNHQLNISAAKLELKSALQRAML
jgi:hypothetical protein